MTYNTLEKEWNSAVEKVSRNIASILKDIHPKIMEILSQTNGKSTDVKKVLDETRQSINRIIIEMSDRMKSIADQDINASNVPNNSIMVDGKELSGAITNTIIEMMSMDDDTVKHIAEWVSKLKEG